MKKKKQNGVKSVIIVLILILLVVGYYFYLSNKTKEQREVKTITMVDEALLRNLDRDYPPSPKEVVKYYAELTKCFYDGGYTDEQLTQLALKSRELFDEELKSQQSDEAYLNSLKLDIENYAKDKIVISSYSTSSSVDVEYWKDQGREYASLYCMYNIRQGSILMGSNHEFVLRRDDDGHWKILGWQLVAKED